MRYMQIPCDTYEQMSRTIDNLKEKCRSIEAGNAIVLADCGAHIKTIESQRDRLLERLKYEHGRTIDTMRFNVAYNGAMWGHEKDDCKTCALIREIEGGQ